MPTCPRCTCLRSQAVVRDDKGMTVVQPFALSTEKRADSKRDVLQSQSQSAHGSPARQQATQQATQLSPPVITSTGSMPPSGSAVNEGQSLFSAQTSPSHVVRGFGGSGAVPVDAAASEPLVTPAGSIPMDPLTLLSHNLSVTIKNEEAKVEKPLPPLLYVDVKLSSTVCVRGVAFVTGPLAQFLGGLEFVHYSHGVVVTFHWRVACCTVLYCRIVLAWFSGAR